MHRLRDASAERVTIVSAFIASFLVGQAPRHVAASFGDTTSAQGAPSRTHFSGAWSSNPHTWPSAGAL